MIQNQTISATFSLQLKDAARFNAKFRFFNSHISMNYAKSYLLYDFLFM